MDVKKLEHFFDEHPKVALGFSGGVDSSLLLRFAVLRGVDIAPYFVKAEFQPTFELNDAHRVAGESGVGLRVIETSVLSDPLVAANAPDRCYFCKCTIFSTVKEAALIDGYNVLIDGTNASDDSGDRPGMRATRELGVISPLRLCSFSKSDVRMLSREMGVSTGNKPSYSCLATRIRTGEAITREKLRVVEETEKFLFGLGFTDFRVRLSRNEARIELPESQAAKLLTHRGDVADKFESLGIASTALDLRPHRTEGN